MLQKKELQWGKIGPTNDDFPSMPGKRVEVNKTTNYGSRFGRSFMNMLQSTLSGVKRLSACLFDVFPVSECFEAELGRVEPRSVVDCYAMEAEQFLLKELLVAPLLATLSLAMADSLKTKEWVKLQLGLFRKEVDQALVGLIAGLDLKPKGLQNRAELVYRLVHELIHGLVHGSILGPVHGLAIRSNMNLYLDRGLDLGFSVAFRLDLSVLC